ncbi:cell division protein ZipA C-terminal FtsZ-binding domain-containing protein [Hydrogenophaga sp. OTU3427]|uniref:cell division protein ZipA C-terminal FtsZ-binding domain-containing protein n=1 Tax=Hydrogenophaga sp. OTU3427 TaxID=3043856 RepID=UPI00313F0EB6
MSTLQLSLIVIGVLVLAAVMAYNAWVTRQSTSRKAAQREINAPASTEGGQRIEPVLDGEGQAAAESPADAGDTVPPLPTMPLADKRLGLDPLIDIIAPLALEAVVSGDAVLAALPRSRRVGTKPFAVEGFNASSEEWEAPRAGQRYQALQAGVQLANRSGALNEIEFSEFIVKAQAFADVMAAAPEFPEMLEEVARARELDQFASTHDAQLGFMLRARRAAWSPGYVTQSAARLGFVPGALPGRMVLPGDVDNAPILSLQFDTQAALAEDPEQSALREVSLSLDVPHVARSERPYQRMREAAASLAQAMDGVVTDDNGQPLAQELMDRIGADLESLYDALDGHDLSAGSPQARRLFS